LTILRLYHHRSRITAMVWAYPIREWTRADQQSILHEFSRLSRNHSRFTTIWLFRERLTKKVKMMLWCRSFKGS